MSKRKAPPSPPPAWTQYITIGPIVALAPIHLGSGSGSTLYALDDKGRIWMREHHYGEGDTWTLCPMMAKNPEPSPMLVERIERTP